MRNSTWFLVILALCVANAAVISGTLLPDLDSGVAIDGNNMVDLIEVKGSVEGGEARRTVTAQPWRERRRTFQGG